MCKRRYCTAGGDDTRRSRNRPGLLEDGPVSSGNFGERQKGLHLCSALFGDGFRRFQLFCAVHFLRKQREPSRGDAAGGPLDKGLCEKLDFGTGFHGWDGHHGRCRGIARRLECPGFHMEYGEDYGDRKCELPGKPSLLYAERSEHGRRSETCPGNVHFGRIDSDCPAHGFCRPVPCQVDFYRCGLLGEGFPLRPL